MNTRNQHIPKPNARFAMMMVALGSVIAIIVGSFLAYTGLFLTGTFGQTFDSTLLPAAATGTLTFSGNSYCGDTVNVTDVNGLQYSFYINVSASGCAGIPSGYPYTRNYVNISSPYNTSVGTAANVSAAMAANATFAATITAANPSTANNTVTLTAVSTGIASNAVATTKLNGTNMSWGAATLTGGVDGNPSWATVKFNTMTGYLIAGIMFIIIGAAGVITVIMSMIGAIGGNKRG